MVQTVYPCSKETYVQTLQRFWKDRFSNQRVSGELAFHGNIASQSSPEANTVYLNGEEGNTIYMPEASAFTGSVQFTATAPDGTYSVGHFILEASRAAGGDVTVSLTPATDGSTAATSAGTLTAAADTTLQAVLLQFTPVADKPIAVKGRIDIEGSSMGSSTLLPTTVAAGN